MDLGTVPFLSRDRWTGDRWTGDRADAAVLLAMAVARQAASPTALMQAKLSAPRVPAAAAFAGPVAATIARWGQHQSVGQNGE